MNEEAFPRKGKASSTLLRGDVDVVVAYTARQNVRASKVSTFLSEIDGTSSKKKKNTNGGGKQKNMFISSMFGLTPSPHVHRTSEKCPFWAARMFC